MDLVLEVKRCCRSAAELGSIVEHVVVGYSLGRMSTGEK